MNPIGDLEPVHSSLLPRARADGEARATSCHRCAQPATSSPAAVLRAAGCTVKTLRTASNCTCTELRQAGFSLQELKLGGFQLHEFKGAGFNAKELAAIGFNAKDIKNAA